MQMDILLNSRLNLIDILGKFVMPMRNGRSTLRGVNMSCKRAENEIVSVVFFVFGEIEDEQMPTGNEMNRLENDKWQTTKS